MNETVEPYVGRPMVCEFCGNVRNKKVKLRLGRGFIVCEKHCLNPKGDGYSNKTTLRAVAMVWLGLNALKETSKSSSE